MQVKSYVTHKNIFIFGLVLLVVGMPLSRFLVSISQFILLGNWLVEKNYIKQWNSVKKSKAFWAFISIYLFYIVGLLWTCDYAYGLKDLRIKLPMLWLPILFFTSPPIQKKDYQVIMHFFVLACVVASFCSIAVYFGFTHKKIHHIREISVFESHIRFSLMVVLAILYLFFSFLKPDLLKQKIIYLLIATWLIFFLVFLQSFTGLAILGFLAIVGIIVFLFSKQSFLIKTSFLMLVVGGLVYTGYLINDEYKKLHTIPETNLKTLPVLSLNGHVYLNDTVYKFTENANYTYILICDEELKKEWNKRSTLNYDSFDNQKNILRHTIIRYLTSKGCSKDSVGVSKLTNADIKYIENGYANCLYTNPTNIRTRVHEILWEIAMRKHETNGHSLVMRKEFWKTAICIIKQNFMLGVGTGDVERAFKNQYQKENTGLQKEWQLRSHNQYLATTVALGLVGLLLFLLYLSAPFLSGKKTSVFFLFFMLIELLSFINEDTLETQAGVTFCIFFTQLLFHNDRYNT
jgi:prepilin signal peptidase PulO-like enzyme (type II secretory pathway)